MANESTQPANDRHSDPGQRGRTSIEAVLKDAPASRVSWLSPAHLIWAATLIVALGLYAMFGARSGSSSIRYVTETVATGDLTVVVTPTGSVQPTNKG